MLAITHITAIKLLYGFVSTHGSILMVILVFAHVANESKFAILMIERYQTRNSAKWSEQSHQLFICEVVRVILDVEIVENASNITSILGIPLDCYALSVISFLIHQLTGLGSIFSRIVADEAVPTRAVVLIHRDLQRLNWSVLFMVKLTEYFVELGRCHVLRNLPNKYIAVLVGLGKVSAKERVVKRKASAVLHHSVAFLVHASNLKVPQEVGGLFEHFFVLDAHDSGVEGLGRISPDLRLVL